MKKFLKRQIRYLYNRDVDVDIRIYNMFLALVLVITTIGTIISVVTDSSLLAILFTVGIGCVAALLIWLANRFCIVRICVTIVAVLVNTMAFPFIYFGGGGVKSGINSWFIMGLLFVCLLLSGKRFVIVLLLSIASFVGCYVMEYYHPELVIPLKGNGAVLMDDCLSMLIAALAVGIMMKIQKRFYQVEQKISRERQEEVQQLNQSKSRFLANMSHEIRTPINTIIGLNEMNLREGLSPEMEENCVNIQRASRMLLALINDILDLSKVESGKMEIVPKQYKTGALLSDLVNIHWIRAREKDLRFDLDISPDIPSMLYGDDVRIKQVISNILNNAIKYTHEGSVSLRIRGEKAGQNRFALTISVADTGIGIRKEEIENLFESFKRLDAEKNSSIEGTGLGLAITSQLVELMGGTITVDSVYQRGSVFTIRLEQGLVDASPIGPVGQFLRGSEKGRKQYQSQFEAPEAKVLIVDDNHMNLMVARKLLRATNVQVDLAESGAECLEKTKKHIYHVIFLDHMMPEMDGVETFQKLRSQKNGLNYDTPVIALTANAMSGADKIYRDKGFSGYLAKPINSVLLEEMLIRFLPKELVTERLTEIEDNSPLPIGNFNLQQKDKEEICVTTDSVCDLPPEILQEYGITCICYYIETERGRFRDVEEVSSENLVDYIGKYQRKATPVAPSVEEYETFFANALDRAQRVIHISAAKYVGEGFANAEKAARGFDNVSVVSCGQMSAGMALFVLKVAGFVRDKMPYSEIEAKMETLVDQISTRFIIQDLESVSRADILPKTIKEICNLFNLQPVFTVGEDRIVCSSLYPSMHEYAYRRYIQRQLRKRRADTGILLFVHSGCSVEFLEKMREEIAHYPQFEHVIEHHASASTSCICGLGSICLVYVERAAGRDGVYERTERG